MINSIKICGTNNIKNAVETFVNDGDKYENGAIVKSLYVFFIIEYPL